MTPARLTWTRAGRVVGLLTHAKVNNDIEGIVIEATANLDSGYGHLREVSTDPPVTPTRAANSRIPPGSSGGRNPVGSLSGWPVPAGIAEDTGFRGSVSDTW